MTELLGTLGPAVIGFAGVFVGLIFGRRQVGDQAEVEHGQWLRTLRQAAYVQLLDTWDTAVRTTEEVASRDYSDAEDEGHTWEEDILPPIHEKVTAAWEPVWRAIEQVELSGPPAVAESVNQLRTAGKEISKVVLDFTREWPPHEERMSPALDRGKAARRLALAAASGALQAPPRPGKDPRTGVLTWPAGRTFRGRKGAPGPSETTPALPLE